MWQKLFRYQKYSKFRQTGSGHAADSKLSYTIQFSILMLCAKYQEAGLCGSWEKCDRNYFVTPTTMDSDPYMLPLRNAGDTKKYNIRTLSLNLKLICNCCETGRQKSWPKHSLFYLFLKLVQINFIFSDNVHILYIYWLLR